MDVHKSRKLLTITAMDYITHNTIYRIIFNLCCVRNIQTDRLADWISPQKKASWQMRLRSINESRIQLNFNISFFFSFFFHIGHVISFSGSKLSIECISGIKNATSSLDFQISFLHTFPIHLFLYKIWPFFAIFSEKKLISLNFHFRH